MNNEENCTYCDAFAIFKELMGKHTMEDAFHIVLQNFEQAVINEAFEDGYVNAMIEMSKFAKQSVEDVLVGCTCDECNDTCN